MWAVAYDAFGGPEVLHFTSVERPVPGHGEILIEVRASGLNPFDWKLRSGLLAAQLGVAPPIIPGRDGAGVIAELGSGSERYGLRCGMPVAFIASSVTAGSLAQYCLVPAENVAPLRAGADFTQAAALAMPGLSAWIAMTETIRVASGQRLLVLGGSGAVGSLACRIGLAEGLVVSATRRNPATALDPGVLPLEVGPDGSLATDERFDIIVDTVGGALHDAARALARPGAAMVYLLAAPFAAPAAAGPDERQAQIFGKGSRLAAAMEYYAAHAIAAKLDRVVLPEEAAAAHRTGQDGTGGKIVFQVPEGYTPRMIGGGQ